MSRDITNSTDQSSPSFQELSELLNSSNGKTNLKGNQNTNLDEVLFPKDSMESMSEEMIEETMSISEIEDNPKSFFIKLYNKLKKYIPFLSDTAPIKQTAPSSVSTRGWIEEEIKALKALIESDGLHIDNYINIIARFASLSFFHSGQLELDEIKAQHDSLRDMLEKQKGYYNDNKVFATDILNGAIGIAGGAVSAIGGQHIATAAQLVSQTGQSASKIFGNTVERDKMIIQQNTELLKQMIEQIRAHRAAIEQQTSKMEDQRTQDKHARNQIVGELTR